MAENLITLDLGTPILTLSGHQEDNWTLRDAFEGTQIFGATGSGKTSGSGAALARRMLQLGFGGLILTVKNDERKQWADPKTGYCAQTGRQKDLLILSKGGEYLFDFLEYELQRPGPGAGETGEISRLFSTVLEAAGQGGGSSDPYWSRALNQLLTNCIDMARLATGRVSLRVLSTIIHEAPLSIEETKGEDWQALVRAAQTNAKTEVQKRDLVITLDYFNREFPRLNERTRSSIVSIFTSMADVLLRGTIGGLFASGKFTLAPELTHEGAIILLDLPVKEYGETGRFAQMVFKYVWQKAAERRDKSHPMRPVFLWCDESQELITGHDAAFQATARSSAVATVYLTQNLRNYHARMGGGAKAEADTDSLLGNLGTKIFHANSDPTTNQYAERIFGYGSVQRHSGSISGQNTSIGWSDATEPTVPAKRFTMLRRGSKANHYQVEAIISQTRKWKTTNDNHITAVFEQQKELG
ncbi:MAG TPA: hypothetical protein VHD56_17505 [Tepidisphaeraceae bacterium]|jgi:hypothetical protein|nr:hypothetical protein [Tepidisphaeraceae bacterium]